MVKQWFFTLEDSSKQSMQNKLVRVGLKQWVKFQNTLSNWIHSKELNKASRVGDLLKELLLE